MKHYPFARIADEVVGLGVSLSMGAATPYVEGKDTFE
jgi:hypothetical protein